MEIACSPSTAVRPKYQDWDIVPAGRVVKRVKRLVNIADEVNQIFERFLTCLKRLTSIRQDRFELLDLCDDASVLWAIPSGQVSIRG
jgi:hypothetical protein